MDSRRAAAVAEAAPLSKSAVSRVVATLKAEFATWRTRSLADVDAVYLAFEPKSSPGPAI